MRAIIINTLGAAYSQKDIYFLAFEPGQILWQDAALDQLHDCVELIRQLHRDQTQREPYHVAVLSSLDSFAETEYADHRERVQKVLRAWLVHQLLRPLDEIDLTPECVTEILLCCKNKDNATAPITTYSGMLQIDQAQESPTIRLPFVDSDGKKKALDLSEMLGSALAPFVETPAPDKKEPAKKQKAIPADKTRLDDGVVEQELRSDMQRDRAEKQQNSIDESIREIIDKQQGFRLIRKEKQSMQIQTSVMQTELPGIAAINADLQINLARLIRNAEMSGKPKLDVIHWHKTNELMQLLADADATLFKLMNPDSKQPIYRKLEDNLYSEGDVAKMRLDMLQRLRSDAGKVPGVTDALDKLQESPDDISETAKKMPAPKSDLADQIRKEIRAGMLLFGRERRYFRERYAQLKAQYNRDAVLEDQRKLLDICAGCYTNWRTDERRKVPSGNQKPTEIRRPVLEEEHHKELLAARDSCAEGVLAQLDDFTDVREEAAKLHTEFSSITRLWSPNAHKQNTRKFYRFSAIMGLIFVIIMILPFFMISSQASDLRISRAVAYVLNTALFLALYAVGFTLWLRKMAKEVRELRLQLELLILKSEEKRKESIRRAITTYSKELPRCIIKQLNYNEMVKTDAENALANQKYDQHIQYLRSARKEISDVRTSLRVQDRSISGKALEQTIDFLQPPYAPANQGAYMLFKEREA